MSRSAPYPLRVQSLKQMAVRFQYYAREQLGEQLSAEHWFLLRLNWDFWRLAPAQIFLEGERCFWLKHHSTVAGITLTPAEARIVLAMNHLGSVDTLMGHTNQIIRLLWKQVVLQPGVNEASVSEVLSRWVGLLPDLEPVNLTEKPLLSPNQSNAKLYAFISALPLQAPLFTEQRFAILRLLSKLQVAGLLIQVTPKMSSISRSDNPIETLA